MLTNRWISYAYEYRGKQKIENVGFVKVFVHGDGLCQKVRIQVGIKLYKNQACKCTAYLFRKNIAHRIKEYEIKPKEKDAILSVIELDYKNPCKDGCPMTDYEGIFFLCGDGSKYASCWKNTDINVDEIKESVGGSETKSKEISDSVAGKNVVEDKEIENKLIEEKAIEEKVVEKNMVSELDSVEQIFEGSCELENDGNMMFTKAYKISLQDIGKLPVSNWGYARNSFLLHGYNTEGYIVIGRVGEEKRWMICVGGTYTNKNRYMAKIYGFDKFISENDKDINMDGKGYWGSYIVME